MENRTEVRDVLTPEEVAAYLRLGRTYTFNLLTSGEIPSWKEGRRRLVRRADVAAFVERRLDAENRIDAGSA
jgi:excisionase family DNA binding protein